VFELGSGNDAINDLNHGNLDVGSTATEHDVINVHDYGFADWSALLAAISDAPQNLNPCVPTTFLF
jgi:hypothetical protein